MEASLFGLTKQPMLKEMMGAAGIQRPRHDLGKLGHNGMLLGWQQEDSSLESSLTNGRVKDSDPDSWHVLRVYGVTSSAIRRCRSSSRGF